MGNQGQALKGDQPSQPLLLEVENLPLPPLFAVELPGVEQREKPPLLFGRVAGAEVGASGPCSLADVSSAGDFSMVQ